MRFLYIFFSVLFSFISLSIFAQGTTRIKLTQLEQAKTVESSKAGQIGLTNSSGDQRYAQYVEIDLTPIGFVPTATGNTSNYSEFVTASDGTKWYIDWQGRGYQFPAGGGADKNGYYGGNGGNGGDATIPSVTKSTLTNQLTLYKATDDVGGFVPLRIQVDAGNESDFMSFRQGADSLLIKRSDQDFFIQSTKNLGLIGADLVALQGDSIQITTVNNNFPGERTFLTLSPNQVITKQEGISAEDLTFTPLTAVTTNATLTGNGTSGTPLGVAQQGATSGQVLTWNGSAWLPATPAGGSPTGSAGGDLGGTYPNPTVDGLQGVTVAATTPTLGQLLVYDPTVPNWEPGQADPYFSMAKGNARPGYLNENNGGYWIQAAPDYGNERTDSITINRRQEYFAAPTVSASNALLRWDADTAQVFVCTLTGHATLERPENLKAGGKYTAIIKQNSVGGWSLNFDEGIRIFDHGNRGITTQANATTVIDFVSDGTNLYGTLTTYGTDEGFQLIETFYDSLMFAFEPRRAGYRNNAKVPVTAFGQTCGQIVDPSSNCHLVGDLGDPTTNPTVELTTGRIGHKFDGTNDSHYLRSGKFMAPSFQTGNFTIGLWVKMNADGTNVWIMSGAGDGATSGLNIQKNTSNQINVRLKETGTDLFNYTSTGTLTVANGWTWVQLRKNGTAGELKVLPTSGSAFTETFTITAGTGTNSTQETRIGCYAAGTNFLNGWIGSIYIFKRYMSDASIGQFRDYNPQALFFGSPARVKAYSFFDPTQITGLNAWYDLSDATTLFQDAAGSTAVTTNGDLVYTIKQKNTTYVQRWAQCTANSERCTYNTNVQNSLSVGTWTTLKRHFFNEEFNGAMYMGEGSIFVVFKSTDTTTTRALLSDNSSKKISLSTTQGSDRVLTNYQHAYFSPVDTFRSNSLYIEASQTSKFQWNLLEFRRKGGRYYLCVNGKNLVQVDNYTYNWALNMIGHSSNYFVGQIGEIVWYNYYLDNLKSDIVTQYLAAKWGLGSTVVTTGITDDEDAGRYTLYDTRGTTDDYNGFPYAIMRNTQAITLGQNAPLDTIYVSYKKGRQHNDNQSTGLFNRYKVSSTGALVQVGSTETIWPAVPSPLHDRSTPYFGWLPDGKMIFSGTEYDPAGSPGGRDSIFSIWRTRQTNGVLDPIQTITHPTYPYPSGWFSVTDRIFVYNNAWYVVGYGQPVNSSASRYRVTLIKSTNSGTSWTLIKEWDGNTVSWTDLNGAAQTGNLDLEEPSLYQLSDGTFYVAFRDDRNSLILQAKSTNIESWTSPLKAIFRGYSRPGFLETETHTCVITTRRPGDWATVYYTSFDLGNTWSSSATEIDRWRNTNGGWVNMYGMPVDRRSGYVEFYWGAEFGDVDAGPANISRRIIKIRPQAILAVGQN